ncbi:S-adenosyl-L-methionine-dependent methyltransferase, partial [Mollisia scopiformis]
MLDGSESPISSAIPFQAAPQTAPTIFKHLVPFTELSPTPLSNIEVSIPARHQSTRDPHTSNSSTISSAVTGSTTPISSSSRETRSIRLNNKPRTRTRPPDSRTKSKKGCVAGTPGFQTANSETGSKDQPSIYPKSRRQEFIPPFPPCSERSAVRDLLAEIKSRDTDQSLEQPSFIEFDLSDFSIYLPDNKNYPYELRGLQHLVTRAGCSSFLFDGILTVGNTHRYVSAVPFQICSIGNYGENIHEVDGDIWLQSNINADADIYYRLKTPSPEYREYHDGFLWLANLAKHFVDYCQAAPEQTVFLINFRTDFSQWLREHHGSSPAFQNWYQQYDKDDFRRHITMHIKFLFKETVGVNPELKTEPIFNEVLEMDYIPQQLIVERKTIVTPYVYECFKDLRFGHHLKAMEVSGTPRTQQISQGGCLDLTVNDYVRPSHIEVRVEIPSSIPEPAPRIIQTRSPSSPNAVSPRQRMILNIKSGDVLSVVKDGKGSVWKDEVSRWKTADDCWYVYVQAIHKSTDGTREFDALWLYKASDTSCAKMKYPYQNELFLSDNCTCLQKRITEEEVLSSVKVVWNGRPSERDKRVFIRQTYLENEKFVTLKKAHKRCKHLQAKAGGDPTSHEYQIGQTVLVPPPRKSKFALEPYEVVKFITEGVKEEVAVLRRLQRRQTVDGKGRPNELVYTETLDRIPVRKIEGSCLVRFYKCSDVLNHQIPAPYSRDGTGNAFYITTRLVDVNGIGMVQPIEHNLPASLLQGFDPTEAYARLRGMDLYCGGGNFGRGLEEGGAVHNEWAVDVNREAIYTYFANLPNPNGTKIFFGSVDDLLSQALQGNPKNSNLIPAPGDVDCIFAGSPCQGFSAINSSRNNEQGLKNQSLVASVGAYIDFYRPKYGILENVMTMAQKGRGRDEDVLSQLICAIVGLGYQLQMFVVDAWSCGMPQSRTRLFVSFAAPGLEPLDHPKISHSHPPVKERDRTLGKMANGEAFGRRFRGPTPFEYISAEEGIGELPSIGYGSTYHCTEYPYHISAFPMTERRRQQVESIPKLPRGMNFAKAWNEGRGVLTPEQTSYFPVYRSNGTLRENCSKTSTAWGRMDPKGLITVILSQMAMGDARAGQIIHWDQPRTLTVMEAQRAQGFLDDEILLGGTAASFKILGNSVARGVALALGLALHEAWFKNTPD